MDIMGKITYVLIPLDPCLELGQAKVNFNGEYDRPVGLAICALLRYGAIAQD